MEDSLPLSDIVGFETQTDIITLLENVKCQYNNPSALLQALCALATICNSSTECQEYFQIAGGIEVLKEMLLKGTCPVKVVHAVLYCLACAVRQNVTCQNFVLSEKLLTVIHWLLAEKDFSEKVFQASTFLLSCLIAGNSKGQNLAFETKCLEDLINLLRDCLTDQCDDDGRFSAITRTIGICVNNPQNDKNQRACCSVLPLILNFINTKPVSQSVGHLLTLIGLVVANNTSNQNRIRNCGGIDIMVNLIKHQMVCLKTMEFPHKTIACTVAALDACIADNVDAGRQASELGLIPILIDLLGDIDVEERYLQILTLTIAHVLESSKDCCSLICDGQAYRLLVSHLTDTQDEELFKTIKYILALCKTEEEEKGKKFHEVGKLVHEEEKDDPTLNMASLTAFNEKMSGLLQQLNSFLPDIGHHNMAEQMTDVQVDVYNKENNFKAGTESSSTSRLNPNCGASTHWRNVNGAAQSVQAPDNLYQCQSSEMNKQIYLSPNVRGHKSRAIIIKSPIGQKITHAQNDTAELSEHNSRLTDVNLLNKDFHNNSGVRLGLSGREYYRKLYADHESHDSADQFNASNHCAPEGYRETIVPGTGWDDVCAASLSYTQRYCNRERNALNAKPTCRYPDPGFNAGRSYINDKPEDIQASNHKVLEYIEDESQFGDDYSQRIGVNRNGSIDPRSMRNSQFYSPSQNVSYKQSETYQQGNQDGFNHNNEKYYIHDRKLSMDSMQLNPPVSSAPENFEPNSSRLLVNVRSDQWDNSRERNVQLLHSEDHPMASSRFGHSEPGNMTYDKTEVASSRENSEQKRSAVNQPLNNSENCVHEATFSISEISSGCPFRAPVNKSLGQPHSASQCSTRQQPVKSSHVAHNQQTFEDAMFDHLSKEPPPILSYFQKMMTSLFMSLIPAQLKNSFTLGDTTDTSANSEIKVNKDMNCCPIQQATASLQTHQVQRKNNETDGIGAISSCLSMGNEPDDILSLCEHENTEALKTHTKNFQQNNQNKQVPSGAIKSSNSKYFNNTLEEQITNSGTNEESMSLSKECIGTKLSSQQKRTLVSQVNWKDTQSVNIHNVPIAQAAMSTPLLQDGRGVFIKPIHPALHSTTASFRKLPNIRVAPAPLLTHWVNKTTTPLKQGERLLAPPSPALSEFDAKLMRVAQTRQAEYQLGRLDSIRKSGSETSGIGSMNSTKNDGKLIQKLTPCREKTPPVVSSSKMPRQSFSCETRIATWFCTPQVKFDVPLSSAFSVRNPAGIATLRRKLFEAKPAEHSQQESTPTPKCPGCKTGSELNSRTYNIAIETSAFTCVHHRTVRELEREAISEHSKSNYSSDSAQEESDDPTVNISDHHQNFMDKNVNMPSKTLEELDQSFVSDNSEKDVYNFTSESGEKPDSSPCIDFSLKSVKATLLKKRPSSLLHNRRQRIPYTEQETLNLKEGVAMMGTCWQQILCSYNFHPSRTAVDLKDKYKRLMAQEKASPKQKRSPKPFSMCEIRRLKRGVKTYGYNWKAILAGGRYVPGRTPADLRDKWRSLNKVT